MSINFLPNTALATVALSDSEIYTYAQTYTGTLVEIKGYMDNGTYASDSNSGIGLTGKGTNKAPSKQFTPLAAAPMTTWSSKEKRRYLFYVNDDNYLHDVYYDGSKWNLGDLSKKNWKCAPYSKLAAVKMTSIPGADIICLYYQNSAATGDVVRVNLNEYGWSEGAPPINDPPLLGTSLSAVLEEAGIQSADAADAKDVDPVLFFQYDKLELGSTQDRGNDDYSTYTIQKKKQALSAHSTIAAIDDGSNFWCFYTSDDNNVQRIMIDKDGKLAQPLIVALDMMPIPASAINAVLLKDSVEKIVLFYLLHYTPENQSIQEHGIYASTLTRKSTASSDANAWTVSSRACLT